MSKAVYHGDNGSGSGSNGALAIAEVHFGNIYNTTILVVTLIAVWGGILAIPIMLLVRR